MNPRFRYGIGIIGVSLLAIGTAAAQDTWRWDKPLVLPGDREEGYYSSASFGWRDASSYARSSYGQASSRPAWWSGSLSSRSSRTYSSERRYGTYEGDEIYGESQADEEDLPMPTTGFKGYDPGEPLTWEDLRLYHDMVVLPLQKSLQAVCERLEDEPGESMPECMQEFEPPMEEDVR